MRIVAIIMLILVVLIIAGGNPLEAMKRGVHRKGEASQATRQTSTGLVPEVGGERVKKEVKTDNEKPCYTQKFVSFGEIYVVLNDGETQKVNYGEKYEKCKR